jgi:hypothetical protein
MIPSVPTKTLKAARENAVHHIRFTIGAPRRIKAHLMRLR